MLILVILVTTLTRVHSARSKTREKLPIKEDEVTGLGAVADSRMASIRLTNKRQCANKNN